MALTTFIPMAMAETIKIYPSEDCYTKSSSPNNVVNDSHLRIGYDLTPGWGKSRTYLKFNLTSLGNKQITSATLSIDPVSTVGPFNANLHYVANDNWKENTLTWTSSSSYPGLSLVDAKIISNHNRISFNAISVINESDKILSLVLSSAQETTPNLYSAFFSKDFNPAGYDNSGYWPYLEVTYADQLSPADGNGDGHVSLTEYNDFKYAFKNGLKPGITLTQYNDIKYAFKNGLLN